MRDLRAPVVTNDTALRSRACPVCNGACAPLDSVDFNKSCEEVRGKFLAPAGIPVAYLVCGTCGFAFAPEICDWKLDEFSARIYNADYIQVDPDYEYARPRSNAETLVRMLGDRGLEIRHLDYGGGNGVLSEALRNSGWQSTSSPLKGST